MARENEAVLLYVTLVVATIFGLSSAATITVGGKTGWTVPTSASFYTNWAANQTVYLGDTLVFNFPPNAHTVAEVNKKSFDACTFAKTIGAVHTTGPASITISTPGTHYFLCTIPGHCSGGQKLSVVATGSSSTAPASSPTPSSGATSPATSPAGSEGGATSPSGSITSPSGSPATTTTAEGPAAPAPSLGTSTSVGLLSLVSVVIAALMF